jgi:hypothetical protein
MAASREGGSAPAGDGKDRRPAFGYISEAREPVSVTTCE